MILSVLKRITGKCKIVHNSSRPRLQTLHLTAPSFLTIFNLAFTSVQCFPDIIFSLELASDRPRYSQRQGVDRPSNHQPLILLHAFITGLEAQRTNKPLVTPRQVTPRNKRPESQSISNSLIIFTRPLAIKLLHDQASPRSSSLQ
jgi:hypothetical protein